LFVALGLTSALAQKQPALGVSASGSINGPVPDLESTAGLLGSDLFVRSGATGMVLVVVRGDQVFFRGYGETAPGSRTAPNRDSVVRLCSLTKIFTTDLLTKLVADGTVRLNDPLQRYAPPRAVVPKRTEPITLVELATHTAGLPREVGEGPRGTPHFTYPDFGTRWRWLPSQHLRTTPGTAALYSNVGYDLLSDALESAAHKPYAALLAQRTLNPLHMRQTTFYPNPTQCGRLLIGAYDEGECTVTENTEGSSGLYSTPADMVIWLKYLLGTGGQSLPAQAAAAQEVYLQPAGLVSEKGLDHAGTPTGIGLGWMHLLAPDDPSHLIEKTGGGAGFTTYIAISQRRHAALFLALTEGQFGGHINPFKAANDLLLATAGLPLMPPEPEKPRPAPRRKRRTHR
jgi:D-alanyl-D-alanine-carboxypeptidase/D-alanyl-D-alanine-endopeptidase